MPVVEMANYAAGLRNRNGNGKDIVTKPTLISQDDLKNRPGIEET
jgi:hypothetical protein